MEFNYKPLVTLGLEKNNQKLIVKNLSFNHNYVHGYCLNCIILHHDYIAGCYILNVYIYIYIIDSENIGTRENDS